VGVAQLLDEYLIQTRQSFLCVQILKSKAKT
jgi:hypothetical protein